MTTPNIEPINIKYYIAQTIEPYKIVETLQIRIIMSGPSISKNTILYEDCFTRIYIFSQSIDVNNSWMPINTYIEDQITVVHTEEYRVMLIIMFKKTLHAIYIGGDHLQ